jgi:hypothetical protein
MKVFSFEVIIYLCKKIIIVIMKKSISLIIICTMLLCFSCGGGGEVEPKTFSEPNTTAVKEELNEYINMLQNEYDSTGLCVYKSNYFGPILNDLKSVNEIFLVEANTKDEFNAKIEKTVEQLNNGVNKTHVYGLVAGGPNETQIKRLAYFESIFIILKADVQSLKIN